MIPIDRINIGDIFQNPCTRGVLYYVTDKNSDEKMVLVEAYSSKAIPEYLNMRFWKKNTDRLFSESWRFN